MQFNLVPHPATPPSDPTSRSGRRSTMPARSARSRRPTSGSGSARRPSRFVIPEPAEPERADELVADDLLRGLPRAPRARTATANGISRRRANGPPMISPRYREGMDRGRGRAPPYIRIEDNLTWWALGATIAVDADSDMGARPVRGPRGEGRDQILLGAGPSGRRQARFPRPRLLRRAPALSSAP